MMSTVTKLKSQAKPCAASSPYVHYHAEEWAQYHPGTKLQLSKQELQRLQGFNERLSLQQVENIYLPLCHLLHMHQQMIQKLKATTSDFFGHDNIKAPYLIGVSGSVAVGKSTTSRLLQALLSRGPTNLKVDLITTDGFLFPNAELERRGLLTKKGFPESFNTPLLIKTLQSIKAGCTCLEVPLYSHEHYDILTKGKQLINQPDIVILEGLNLLNTNSPQKQQSPLFVADFLDFSIYVDAKTSHIEQWFLERFSSFRQQAVGHPERYFHRFTQMSDTQAYRYAKEVWRNINEANLTQNILPYKNRAKMILHKDTNHQIESVLLR